MTYLILAIALVAISIAVVFAKAQSLRSIHIQKKVLIDTPLEDAFNQVVLLKNFPNWSPFLEIDPEQKINITGIDGKVGAQYHWIGNKGKDVGYQEIKLIEANKKVDMECDIQKPFKAKPKFNYSFNELEGKVEVSQDFYLESGAIDAFFMYLFGAKKEMEKMNGRGMELLKNHLESKFVAVN